MSLNDIAGIRLSSQQITRKDFTTPKDLVGWMGAIQAQDYHMAKWAIGIRLPSATEARITAAIDQGEIIRTHLLRPTWHFVSAQDIHWMLALTAPQIKTAMQSRHKQLALTDEVVSKSKAVIEKAFLQKKYLLREEIVAALEKANIATTDNRAAHLLMLAELDGLIGSGPTRDKKHTYALLEERVPKIKPFHRDEALTLLARKYFSSHGPATLKDFVWWSGLSMKEAKYALAMIKSDFISETIHTEVYWLPNVHSIPKKEGESVFLLPAFDEYIIGFKNRRAAITSENHKKAVSNNGVFWPIIVRNGQIRGTWRRTIKKEKVIVTTALFQSASNNTMHLIEKEAQAFGNFLGKKTEFNP